MVIKFNKEKLTTLLDTLGLLTGATLSFWDRDGAIVAQSRGESPFCLRIRKTKEYHASCMISDRRHFAEAEGQAKTVFYSCHAGITETLTPCYYDGTLIGYLMIGRFRDGEKIYSVRERVENTVVQYGLDCSEMMRHYDELPVLSGSDLNGMVRLFNWSLKGIWQEGLAQIDNDVLVMRIESYVAKNLAEKITLSTLCKVFSLSKHALYALFEKNFHTTVNGYITAQRVAKAKSLLANTDKSITEIAAETGFDDYNYFIRVFKRETLSSPARFRRGMRGIS